MVNCLLCYEMYHFLLFYSCNVTLWKFTLLQFIEDFDLTYGSIVFQLWYHPRIFWGYFWFGKRIWAFPSGNLWSLHWYWSKDGLQNEDMFNLWWEGSSNENWANTFWHVFTGIVAFFLLDFRIFGCFLLF